MKIEAKPATMLVVSGVQGLDPVRVICENIEPGRGRLIMQCCNSAWAAYWGGMADYSGALTVEAFVCQATPEYILENVKQSRREPQESDWYTLKVIKAAQEALRKRLPRQRPDRDARLQRIAEANDLIAAISRHGRRFFFDKSHQRVARLELAANGRIYFRDDYSWKAIYTGTICGHQHRWRGFSHGGTLKDLVRDLVAYVQDPAKRPRKGMIAPQRLRDDDGDIWGYGDAAQACRDECHALPIFAVSKK